MGKKQDYSFKSVVTVNPYKNIYCSDASGSLNIIDNVPYNEEQFIVSYLNTKSVIYHKIKISKNIADEDLYDAITNQAYDELVLDQALIYKMQFIETFTIIDEDYRFFHLFIIDPLDLDEIYNKVVNKVKYIDIIVPTPLLLKSLYLQKIIKTDGVDCFIYLQENDAFITVYNEEEFVYTKSISYSFVEMHKRFCVLYAKEIEYKEFIDFLLNEDLRNTQSEYKKYFIKLYKELFSNIKETLTKVNKYYEIEKIQHLYVGTQLDTLTKLDEIAEFELDIRASDFNFNYDFINDDQYVDQLHSLMLLYAREDKSQRYECNFSVYNRPPKFTQRVSGRLIILTILSFIIAFIYPATFWVMSYAKSLQFEIKNEEYKELHIKKDNRDKEIKNREAEKKKIIDLLKHEKQEYASKKATLIKIHDVKVNYPMKAKLLAILIKDLNKFRVKINSMSYTQADAEKNFVLNLVASSDKDITKLLEYLTKVYTDKFSFSIEEISYEDDNRKYFCELKVKL